MSSVGQSIFKKQQQGFEIDNIMFSISLLHNINNAIQIFGKWDSEFLLCPTLLMCTDAVIYKILQHQLTTLTTYQQNVNTITQGITYFYSTDNEQNNTNVMLSNYADILQRLI